MRVKCVLGGKILESCNCRAAQKLFASYSGDHRQSFYLVNMHPVTYGFTVPGSASRPMCFAIEHALFDFCDCLPGVQARTFCRAYRIRTRSRQSAELQKPAQQAGNSLFPDIVSGCRASLTCVWQLSPTQITTSQSHRQIPPSLGPRNHASAWL